MSNKPITALLFVKKILDASLYVSALGCAFFFLYFVASDFFGGNLPKKVTDDQFMKFLYATLFLIVFAICKLAISEENLVGIIRKCISELDKARADLEVQKDELSIIDSVSEYSTECLKAATLCKNKIKNARFIEYSATNASVVIRDLLNKGWRVELCVAHPYTAPTLYQFERLVSALTELRDIKSNYDKLDVFCYTVPASFRARHISGRVFLSWYTYGRTRVEKKMELFTSGVPRRPCEIDGAENHVISCSVNSGSGHMLKAQFDSIWKDLTEYAVSLKEVQFETEEFKSFYSEEIFEYDLPKDRIFSAIFGVRT